MVRDDVKFSMPWKIEDLKEVGIEDFDYYNNIVDKNDVATQIRFAIYD